MPIWIPVALAAALVQTVRFLLQRRLKGLGLTTGGATFSRFVFGAPLAWLLVAAFLAAGSRWPGTGAEFWGWCLLGGIGQMIGTYYTVAMFAMRNFAVGIAFTKTETVQVALFSAVILSEPVSPGGFLAIIVGMLGVILLSWPRGGALSGAFLNRTLAIGLAAGAAFAVSAIAYRAATLSLGGGGHVFRATVTLACVSTLQTLLSAALLAGFEPKTLGQVARSWRATFPVGLTGMLGSLGWFIAFTLQNAAYVRAFGQIELVFGLLAGRLFLAERMTRRELAGLGLLGIGLLAIVLAA